MTDETIEIEIDGKSLSAQPGQMLIEVADANDIRIPRFCYHKKLTVAANCRMCLVEVEKSPKPLPACATPVAPGMVVQTHSAKALDAQKSVMEFLLINHPLDCPICDQGGQCELQDVAMGYGKDVSRYTERKRVVADKDIGPLIATEMTRCIHCTRCVRFGEEVAGLRELGATGRGEFTEIGTYISHSIKSELSGNVIDLCPVGALTAKPSRFTSRPWELEQMPTIAPHDCVGSNMYLHTRRQEVMRAAPRENEALNETWLSDRDRFSYEGIHSKERLLTPRIKRNGKWVDVDWQTALNVAKIGLEKIIASHTAEKVGALISPSATTEEMYLLQKLLRSLDCHNVDHRLRQADFSGQGLAPNFYGTPIRFKELSTLDSILLVGSHLQYEQPIVNLKVRKASLAGGKVMALNPIDYDFNYPLHAKVIAKPFDMLNNLIAIAKVLAQGSSQGLPGTVAAANVEVNDNIRAIAAQLKASNSSALILGAIAFNHPQFNAMYELAELISDMSGSQLVCLPEGANSAGAWLAGAIPHREAVSLDIKKPGLDAKRMMEAKLKAYITFGIEPELDCANPSIVKRALDEADFNVVVTAFSSDSIDAFADVQLPLATFAETSGSYVNAEGGWQTFKGTVKPKGEARPGWKILRVLGNLFDVEGFAYTTSIEVQHELRKQLETLQIKNRQERRFNMDTPHIEGLQRISTWPIYRGDSLVRHAESLQQTTTNDPAAVAMNSKLAAELYLKDGGEAVVKQQYSEVRLPVRIDERVPDGCAYIPGGYSETAALGECFGKIDIERS